VVFTFNQLVTSLQLVYPVIIGESEGDPLQYVGNVISIVADVVIENSN
jgi:hypothetical protein